MAHKTVESECDSVMRVLSVHTFTWPFKIEHSQKLAKIDDFAFKNSNVIVKDII